MTLSERNGLRFLRDTGTRAMAGVFLLFWLLPGWGAGVRQLSVTHADGEFVVTAELDLQTSKEGVFRVLADYGRWHRLNRSIISSRVLSSRDGHHFVRSMTRACLLFFCREIAQTQDITEVGGSELIAVTLPEAGNLRQGVVRWRLEPEGREVRVLLFARLVPDFWIPPLIGPWSIKTALRREALETAGNLERLAVPVARGTDPPPGPSSP